MAGMLPSQGGSISDILTTLKNVVTSIANAGNYIQGIYNNIPTNLLFSGSATLSSSILYTASSQSKSHVNNINICNTSSSSQTFSVFFVQNGSTPSISNAIFYNCTMNPYSTVLWTGSMILLPQGTLQASASSTSVTFMVSGNGLI